MRWVGNSESMKVHECTCDYVDKIWPGNLVEFEELFDALGQGYEEAACCLTDRPMRLVYSAPNIRARRAANGCLVCGEKRAVQHAHILPRGWGCHITIELCANHHWFYDSGKLTDDEFDTLERAVRAARGKKIAGYLAHGHGAVRASGREDDE